MVTAKQPEMITQVDLVNTYKSIFKEDKILLSEPVSEAIYYKSQEL